MGEDQVKFFSWLEVFKFVLNQIHLQFLTCSKTSADLQRCGASIDHCNVQSLHQLWTPYVESCLPQLCQQTVISCTGNQHTEGWGTVGNRSQSSFNCSGKFNRVGQMLVGRSEGAIGQRTDVKIIAITAALVGNLEAQKSIFKWIRRKFQCLRRQFREVSSYDEFTTREFQCLGRCPDCLDSDKVMTYPRCWLGTSRQCKPLVLGRIG